MHKKILLMAATLILTGVLLAAYPTPALAQATATPTATATPIPGGGTMVLRDADGNTGTTIQITGDTARADVYCPPGETCTSGYYDVYWRATCSFYYEELYGGPRDYMLQMAVWINKLGSDGASYSLPSVYGGTGQIYDDSYTWDDTAYVYSNGQKHTLVSDDWDIQLNSDLAFMFFGIEMSAQVSGDCTYTLALEPMETCKSSHEYPADDPAFDQKEFWWQLSATDSNGDEAQIEDGEGSFSTGSYYYVFWYGTWNGTRKDIAYTFDNSHWYPLNGSSDGTDPGQSLETCAEYDYDQDIYSAVIRASSTEMHLRVNDIASDFANNTGGPVYYWIIPTWANAVACQSVQLSDPSYETAVIDDLADGNLPGTFYWSAPQAIPEDFFPGTNWASIPSGRYQFGFWNFLVEPNPQCGQYAVKMGQRREPVFIWQNFSYRDKLFQTLDWSGCNRLYYSITINGGSDSELHLYMHNMATGADYDLISGQALSNDYSMGAIQWDTYTGNIQGPPSGRYQLIVETRFDGSGPDPYSHWAYVDTVQISSSAFTFTCTNAGYSTPTPTPTPTGPTPTLNLTATPTASPTPTPGGTPGPQIIRNCGFSQGSSYWTTNVSLAQWLQDPLDGTNYVARALDGAGPSPWRQSFSWPGGDMFVRMDVRNLPGNVPTQDSWVFWDLPADNYWLNLRPDGGYTLSPQNYPLAEFRRYMGLRSERTYDNIAISQYNFSDCVPGAYPTPTPWATQTPGPSPTWAPSSTPTRTPTAWPTWTPRPPTSTSTPVPSHTPLPSATMTGPELTSTAQGTVVSTYTPYPTYTEIPTYTPGPTADPNGWPTAMPPQQPPSASCTADCVRPDNPLALASWLEYGRCEGFKGISWCQSHSATAVAMPSMFTDREPFASINSLQDAQATVQAEMGNYDWANTGSGGSQDEMPALDTFFPYNPTLNAPVDMSSPYFGGAIDLTPAVSSYETTCAVMLSERVGPALGQAMCFGTNAIRELGLYPWFQWFANLAAAIAFMLYIYKRILTPMMH